MREFPTCRIGRWDEVFRRSCLAVRAGVAVRVLGPEDQLRLLCLHLARAAESAAPCGCVTWVLAWNPCRRISTGTIVCGAATTVPPGRPASWGWPADFSTAVPLPRRGRSIASLPGFSGRYSGAGESEPADHSVTTSVTQSKACGGCAIMALARTRAPCRSRPPFIWGSGRVPGCRWCSFRLPAFCAGRFHTH